MPDPKAPDSNPMKDDIDKVSKAGRDVLRYSAPNQLATGASKTANSLRSLAKRKLGF